MGQESRARAAARGKAKEMREAEHRREQRHRLLVAGACFVAVIAIIGGLVALKASGVGASAKAATPSAAAPASSSLEHTVTSVPPATLDSVGAGSASNPPTKIKAPALTKDGKPQVLYVGAEYCPYCAAERWPMAVALSRFGTLTGLGTTHSSSIDVNPNTPTLTFHGSSFTSDYLTFTPYETTTNEPDGNSYKPLDTLSAEDQKVFDTYDYPPYVTSKGAIPFIDFGGKYVQSGASYDPGLLAGKTHEEIAAALSDPSSDIAKAVDGTANVFTAAICATTDQQPAAVCNASGVKAAAAKLGTGS